MRALYFIVNIIFLLLTCHSYADDSNLANPYINTYPFKSAIIHYDIRNEYGHGKSYMGTEIVYIKGDKLAKITRVTVPGTNGKVKKVENMWLFTPDYIYKVDLVEKTGTKIDNPKKYNSTTYDNLSKEEKTAFHNRMNKRGIISFDLLGLGTKVGTESILDHECNVYESGKELTSKNISDTLESGEGSSYMKSWIWKTANIPLKVKTTGLGWSDELISTKVEENASVPENIFKVPSGIKITYDQEKSDFAKREALARFELYKTGQPMVVRMKLKREKLEQNAKADPVSGNPNRMSSQIQN